MGLKARCRRRNWGGHHDALAAVRTSGFEECGGAQDVGANVPRGVFDAGANARFGGEVNHTQRAVLGEEAGEHWGIADIALDEAEECACTADGLCNGVEVRLFVRTGVERIEVVEPDDGLPTGQ